MNKKRIIPCLDVDNGRVVKGKKFRDVQDVADPVALAEKYNETGADELTLYDITASAEGRKIFLNVVERVAAVTSIPFTVGGGIRTTEDIQQIFQAGADKVSINSAAINNPHFLEEAANAFGPSRIVLAMDVKEMGPGEWHVFNSGGQNDTEISAIEWARSGEKLGAGEIVVNAIDSDGAKNGYNLPLTKAIAAATTVPIVASGGAGEEIHFASVLQDGEADAALAASVFHYGEINIAELKKYLAKQNTTFSGRVQS